MISTERGFTLIETLLYIVIASGLFAAMATYYSVAVRSEASGISVNVTEQQAEHVLSQIETFIDEADGVNTASGSTLSLSDPDSGDNPTEIQLTSGVVEVRRGGSGPYTPLHDDSVSVTALSFIDSNRVGTSDLIRIRMTTEFNNSSGRAEYDYSEEYITTIGIRP